MAFEQFGNRYYGTFGLYNHLQLKEEDLKLYYEPLLSLTRDIEDFTDNIGILFKEHKLGKLNSLFGLLAKCDTSIDITPFLRLIINDLVLLSCIVPCINEIGKNKPFSLYEYQCVMVRYSVTPLTPVQANQILDDIILHIDSDKTFDIKKIELLSHLDPHIYTLIRQKERTLCQALSSLYLVNFTSELKNRILNDPLYLEICSSQHLKVFMLGCSAADQQYYLNTCDVATTLNALVLYHPNIASLLVFGEVISSYLWDKIAMLNDRDPAYKTLFGNLLVPSRKDFITRVLTNFDNQTRETRDKCYKILRKDHIHLEEVNSLMFMWNEGLQHLSSIFIPEMPVMLTRKIFSERWHLSAKVMTAYSFFAQFVPGMPSFLSRACASKDLTQVPCFNFYSAAFYEIEDPTFPRLRRRLFKTKGNLIEQRKVVEEFWLHIIANRSVLFDTPEVLFGFWHISHLSLCTASVLKRGDTEEKVFLVSDPEIKHYKVMTIDEMIMLCAI